jgi:hypothetical protein
MKFYCESGVIDSRVEIVQLGRSGLKVFIVRFNNTGNRPSQQYRNLCHSMFQRIYMLECRNGILDYILQ